MEKKIRINFITLFLLFCTVYMGINATLNITKIVSYNLKINQLEESYNKALTKKIFLISEIDGYKSHKKYEEFARNNMGYAAPDEIRLNLIPQKEIKEKRFSLQKIFNGTFDENQQI